MTELVPMDESDYDGFLEDAVATYAADKVAAGQWTPAESQALSRQSFFDLLPQGLATPEHRLFTIVDETSDAVGVLWIAAQERAGERVAYIYNIRIKPDYQRRGHATRALLALEQKMPAMGLSGIALHVFGHNTGAQALYAKLGYVAKSIIMYKPIELLPAKG